MSVNHVVTVNQETSIYFDREDYEYIYGAARERGQEFDEFAREALLEWAAR